MMINIKNPYASVFHARIVHSPVSKVAMEKSLILMFQDIICIFGL